MGKSEKNIMKENEEMKPVHIQCRKKRKEKSVCCCYCSRSSPPTLPRPMLPRSKPIPAETQSTQDPIPCRKKKKREKMP